MATYSLRRNGPRIGILLVTALLVGLIYWLVFGPAFGLRSGFKVSGRVVDDLTRLTGLSRFVIGALGWTGFAVVTTVIYVVRKRFGRTSVTVMSIALAALAAVYQVGLFSLTRETNFTNDGEAARYYALTQKGVVYSDRPGVDSQTGIPLRPMTPDVVAKLQRLERGEFKPVDPNTADWFNPITGDVQLWYYRTPGGELEFYEFPGYHPGSRAPLEPVTPELKAEYDARQRAARTPAPPPEPSPSVKPGRSRPLDDGKPRRAPAEGPVHDY